MKEINELTRRLLAEGYTPEDTPPGMREYEDYEGGWGDIPLAYAKTTSQGQLTQDFSVNPVGNPKTGINEPTGQNMKPQDNKTAVTESEMQQLDDQIQKAAASNGELIPVMLEIRKALMGYRQKAGE